MKLKNKKGTFHAEALTQFLSFIVLILVIIIFSTLFGLRGCKGKVINQEIIDVSSSVEEDYILLNYLRTPVTVSGDNMQMSDLIIHSYLTNNYGELDKLTEKYFKESSLNDIKWSLNIDSHRIDNIDILSSSFLVEENLRNLTLPTHLLVSPILIRLNEHYFVKVVVQP